MIRPKQVSTTILGNTENSFSVNTENWKIEKNSIKNDTELRTHFCFPIYTQVIKPKNNFKNLKILVKMHFLTKLQFLRKNHNYWRK